NIERLAMTVNRWPEVSKLYDAQLDKLAETENREPVVDLGLRNAQVFEVQPEDVVGAIVRYRRVADVDPENLTAIRALDRLYAHTERWSELAAILGREAEIGQSPDETLELKY